MVVDPQPLAREIGACFERAQHLFETLSREQRLRPAGVEQLTDLARDQAEVDRDEHGAELGRREQRLDELIAVVEQRGDAVATADAQRREPVGEPARAFVQRRVRIPARAEDERGRIGMTRGVDGELIADHRFLAGRSFGCRRQSRRPRTAAMGVPDATVTSWNTKLEVVSEFRIDAVAVVVSAEVAVGGADEDVDAEADRRVLRWQPVKARTDEAARVLEALHPQDLRLQ